MISRYLQQLEFKEKSFGRFLREYVSSPVLAGLILLLIVFVGSLSFYFLPRTVNPSVNLTIVTVETFLPGASVAETEELLAVPLEEEIKSVAGIDKLQNDSFAGRNLITVEFVKGVDGNRALSDVRNAVRRVRDLPEYATEPLVELKDFDNEPIVRLSLFPQNPETDRVSLERFARRVIEVLEESPLIDEVVKSGLSDEEVQIIADPNKLASFGLSAASLADWLKSVTTSFPGGAVVTAESRFNVSVEKKVSTLEQLRALSLPTAKGFVRLDSLGPVLYRNKPDKPLNSIVPAGDREVRPAVVLTVFRVAGTEVSTAVAEVHRLVKEEIARQNDRFAAAVLSDVSADMRKQFGDLRRNLIITVFLVLIALSLFIGFRQALIASLSIPAVYLAAFGVMALFDLSINFISLFSLLLALGIIVDVAIVVVSAMTVYYRTGKFTPVQTGLLVWRDFFVTLSVTTLTTIWAFVPLFLSTGIIGEFIKPIPIVVSGMLVASVLIGFVVAIPLLVYLLRREEKRLEAKKEKISRRQKFFRHGLIKLERAEELYRRFLRKTLASRRRQKAALTIVIAAAVFSFALLPLGAVKREFFPKENMDRLYVTVKYPAGEKLSVVSSRSEELSRLLSQVSGVEFVNMQIGLKLDERAKPLPAGENRVLFTLLLTPEKERANSRLIAEQLRRKFGKYAAGELMVAEPTNGPPTGADITLKFKGDDFVVLDRLASEAVEFLENIEGVINIRVSGEAMPPKLVFVPELEKISSFGLNVPLLAEQLRLYLSGDTLVENVFFADLGKRTNVVLRYTPEEPSADVLSAAQILSPDGRQIPLASLGKWEMKSQMSEIRRQDGKRTKTVLADVKPGVSAVSVNRKLLKHVEEEMNLPSGYEYLSGGSNEENIESVKSILKAMVLASVLIFATLVFQLRSYRQALIVLSAVPLAVAGVFLLFALSGTTLSFPALIGILALFGIVVNNSIIIVTQINANLRAGLPFLDSIVDGAAGRLEPIFLSSLTTIVGLLPITLSDPIWRGLGSAIIAGMIFSGTVMLIFIPVMFAVAMKPSKKFTENG